MPAAQQQPVRLRQEAPLAAPPFTQRPAQPAKPKLLPMIGALAALVIVISGIVTMITIRNNNLGNGSRISATATASHSKTTPSSGQQQTSGKSSTLPAPMSAVTSSVNVGSMIYGTSYPANCNDQNNWSKQDGIQATCKAGEVQLANTGSSNTSGMFLDKQMGNAYYIQVQATAVSGKFSIYVNKTDQGMHGFTVDLASGSWEADYYPSSGGSHYLFSEGFPTSIQITNTTTIGIIVNKYLHGDNNFDIYINNVYEGSARTGFTNNGGNVGIGVDTGSNVSFKNFAVYQ